MDDLISRQAALDAFGLSEKTRKYGGDHSGYDPMMLYEIQDVLEGLPSVTPALNVCEDAISRADAIRVASGYCHWTNIPAELAKLPPVTPAQNVFKMREATKEEREGIEQYIDSIAVSCEDAISRQAVKE